MPQSSKIVFFGNERLSSGFAPEGAPTLQKLIDAGYDVVAVVSNFERASSRSARELEIAEVAKKHNIPLLLPNKLSEIAEQLADFKADIGVLVAYGKIIPQSIIDIFPHGILNIHPSLLPKYRGSTPIETAILDGATKTGVSIMGLVKAMDAGPIYAQKEVALTGTETKQQLTAELLQLGSEMLIEVLPEVLNGTATPKTQNEADATFTRQLSKNDTLLDQKKPAEVLEREIRAFQTWPKSRITVFGHQIIVLEAAVVGEMTNEALIIPCAGSTYLQINQLIAPSGKRMSGIDFIRGYRK